MKAGVRLLTASVAVAALLPLMAQQSSPRSRGETKAPGQSQTTQGESRGEQLFKQNCARCHEAPQGFPAQNAGTIVRHMRVRASLSARDEKALMDFMNPK